MLFNGKNIFDMAPDERAAAGLFLAFQYPLEIPGVATMTFLRTALNAQRKKRGEAELSTPEFIKRVRETAGKLNIDQDMLRRAVNVGFSGGEKKRNEILQMALLEPRLAVLDETNSGLDIDALQDRRRRRQPLAIAAARRSSSSPTISGCSSYIVPDIVHVLSAGRIVKTGGKELALELEARGYAEYQEEAAGVNAGVTTIKTAAETELAQVYARARGSLPGDDAVAAQREAAFGVFAKEGLPHRRVEDWKYTDLRALMREAKPLAPPPDAAAKALAKSAGARCSATSRRAASSLSTAPSSRNCPIWQVWKTASPSARWPRRCPATIPCSRSISASWRRQPTSPSRSIPR